MQRRHVFRNPLLVASQLLHGKSLTRALFNLALRDHSVQGEVLDLGSKTKDASYYKFLRSVPGTKIVLTDLRAGEDVRALNVELPFDLPTSSFDIVLAFHLFEHVFYFQRAPAEIFRILRPGGRALVAVPFLIEYHADPDDYIRLTDSGLIRWGEHAGLRCIHLEAIGEGLTTAFVTQLPNLLLPRLMRPWTSAFLYLLATPFDRLFALRPRVTSRTVPERFALEFFAVFEKPL